MPEMNRHWCHVVTSYRCKHISLCCTQINFLGCFAVCLPTTPHMSLSIYDILPNFVARDYEEPGAAKPVVERGVPPKESDISNINSAHDLITKYRHLRVSFRIITSGATGQFS
jgi:hypothetical protein